MKGTDGFHSTFADHRDPSWPNVFRNIEGRATHAPPELKRNGTASCFANWVFYCQHPQETDRRSAAQQKRDRAFGTFNHYRIQEFWEMYRKRYSGAYQPSEWAHKYSDSHDESTKVLRASRLVFQGSPILCKPDAVLRNRTTNEILIIERKMTYDQNPNPFLWGSLRAQLWCYSMIDDWINAPEVYLVGETWVYERGSGRSARTLFDNVVPRYRRSDTLFNREMKTLFELYGGTVKQQ